MISRITAVEFIRPMSSGRTGPLLLNCEDGNGEFVEIVAKFSAGCEQGELHLAREVYAACLAGMLELPIPVPYLVDIPSGFENLIENEQIRQKISNSSSVAFGSKLLSGQYGIWTKGSRITSVMRPVAVAILIFDLLTQNFDRKADNPNCFIKGNEIRIFDHDLSLVATEMIIGHKHPWQLGGLRPFEIPGSHIFLKFLKKRNVDLSEVKKAWKHLSTADFNLISALLPDEWSIQANDKGAIVGQLQGISENIDDCFQEVMRVLS